MAGSKKPSPTQKDFKHVWHVREWLDLYQKRHADLVKELNWSRAKASDVLNGQQYTQSLIDDLAPWLNAKPFELLMAPADAMALRAMRKAAVEIAADNRDAEPKAISSAPDTAPGHRRAS